jgi:hypothetical protein
VESDEHAFIFRNFDFKNGTFDFALDDGEAVNMPFNVSGGNISKLELRTNGIGVGRMIRLRYYKQYVKDELADFEEFPVHWKPIPPPPDGMPDDNICESKLRPVGNRWLELSTKYGFVMASIPAIPKGALEFDVKTPNVEQEACIILGEYDGSIKCYRKIQTGILSGRIPIATDTGNAGFQNFDDPITPVNNEVYRFKIAWNKATNKQRIWINDIPQKYSGAHDIEIYGDWCLPKHLTRGIDAITLHPGYLGTVRATSLQKAQSMKDAEGIAPLITHWGKFRLYP